MRKQSNYNFILFIVMGIYLTLTFLGKIVFAADEASSRTIRTMDLVLTAAVLVGLVGLKRDFGKTLDPDDPKRRTAAMVFWPGLLSGLGLLALTVLT